MGSPQESTGARIVPFPQPTGAGRPQPQPATRVGLPGRTAAGREGAITSDQLLDMIALAEPLPNTILDGLVTRLVDVAGRLRR